MLPLSDADEPQLPFNDPTQYRYALIRPLVLFQDRTAKQRAQETGTHPDTVGTLKRRFEAQGMLGLVPDTLVVVPAGRRRRVPAEVVHELQRLKPSTMASATENWLGSSCIPWPTASITIP